MIQIEGKASHRWLLPLVAAAILFLSLFFLIPYASGYWNTKVPLGIMLWKICMEGQRNHAALDFSYCLLVPFITAFLIYIHRDQIAREPIQGCNSAMGLIVVSLLLYWLGLRAEMQVVGYAAMQILLAGIIIWLWGWRVFRALLFPWAFFAFFWPVPFLDSTVASPLRMLMTQLAHDILQVTGIPVIRNGTALISAPDPLSGLQVGQRFRIDIADPCSGIRSLFALTMISALFAYLFLNKLWQQWVLFLSAFPLTIIGNLARVLMLIGGSILFGSSFAIGTDETPSGFHEFAGFMVYGVALGLEIGLGFLLTSKWGGQEKAPRRPAESTSQPEKLA